MFNYLKELKGNREEGFTLTELIVVIVIIGILAAIAVPMYLNNRKQAIDAQTESNVKSIASTADRFYYDNPQSLTLEEDIVREMKFNDSTIPKIFANANAQGYCIMAWNEAGSKYVSNTEAATFDSSAGGLGKWSSGCEAGITNGGGTPPGGTVNICSDDRILHSGNTTTGEQYYINVSRMRDYIYIEHAILVDGTPLDNDPGDNKLTVTKNGTLVDNRESVRTRVRAGQEDRLLYIRHAPIDVEVLDADKANPGIPADYEITYTATDDNGKVYTVTTNTSSVNTSSCDENGWRVTW